MNKRIEARLLENELKYTKVTAEGDLIRAVLKAYDENTLPPKVKLAVKKLRAAQKAYNNRG